MTDRLQGKVAIITGGTGGMGVGIAECFVREGAKVALTDIKESDASRSFMQEHPGQVVFHTLDVTDEDQWVSTIDTVEKELGQLTTVVNNAGIGGSGATMDQESYEDWKKVIAINLNGTFLGTKHGMRVMKGRGGSIINISSIEGFVGLSGAGAYNASKGGTRLLTKSAALHDPHAVLGAKEGSVQIDGNDLFPVLVAFLVHSGSAAAYAGIVDHGGQLTQLLFNGVDGGDPLVLIRHIQGVEDDLPGVLLHEAAGSIAFLDVGKGHLGSLADEAFGDAYAHATGSSGDDGYLTL